jgi:hypothetical protein
METKQFRNIGYILHKLQDSELSHISQRIKDIQDNFDTSTPVNYQLIGQIEREFDLGDDKKCQEEMYKILMPLVEEYENHFTYLKNRSRLLVDKSPALTLESLWVNYQKKYEFNPTHNHNGVYSFVIWHKIPYSIEDEKQNSPGKKANNALAGHFEFQFTNSLGNILQESLPVDKEWNNTICLFPAEMIHNVYPFFTSDDYRITISGNISLEMHR